MRARYSTKQISQIGGQPILAFHKAHTRGHQRTGERPPARHRQHPHPPSPPPEKRGTTGAKEVQNEPEHQQWRSQIQRLLGSICPLFPGPRPPIYSGLPQRVPGIFALCLGVLDARLLRWSVLLPRKPCPGLGQRAIANCVPWNSGSPLANTSIDLSSIAETATFMSRSFVLQRTEAPASRHTRAKLRSGPTARVRSRPDLGQAPRCLPSKSKRQPHSQRASVISSGRRNLSITRARKRCGSTTNSGWEGAPHKTSLEPGPECERKCATWSSGHGRASNTVSLKWCSRGEDA